MGTSPEDSLLIGLMKTSQTLHCIQTAPLVEEYRRKNLIFFWSKCGDHTWMSAVANSETYFQKSWKDLPRTQWLPLPALWCYNSHCRQCEPIEDRLAAIKAWKVAFSAAWLAIKVCNSWALFTTGQQEPWQLIIVTEKKKKSLQLQVGYWLNKTS